jgi:hypothetical protein
VALGAPYLVNATRATQHLDMNAKTIYNATIDGYNIKTLSAGSNISISGGSGNFTIINTAPAAPERRGFRYFNNGVNVPKVVFNLGAAIDIRNFRVKGTLRAQIQPNDGNQAFNFPWLDFNNFHVYPTQTGSISECGWQTTVQQGNNPLSETQSQGFTAHAYGRNAAIAQLLSIGTNQQTPSTWFITTFEIDCLYNGGNGTHRGISCEGNCTLISKNLGGDTRQYIMGTYCRHSDVNGGTSTPTLTHLGFGTFTYFGASRGMSFVELHIEIIPTSNVTVQSS